MKKCSFRFTSTHNTHSLSCSLKFNLDVVVQSLAVVERAPEGWCCKMKAQKKVWHLHPSQPILREVQWEWDLASHPSSSSEEEGCKALQILWNPCHGFRCAAVVLCAGCICSQVSCLKSLSRIENEKYNRIKKKNYIHSWRRAKYDNPNASLVSWCP